MRLDDLDQLVDSRVAGEQRLTQQQLRHDAADGPDVYRRAVVRRPKDQLRRPVVPAPLAEGRQDSAYSTTMAESSPVAFVALSSACLKLRGRKTQLALQRWLRARDELRQGYVFQDLRFAIRLDKPAAVPGVPGDTLVSGLGGLGRRPARGRRVRPGSPEPDASLGAVGRHWQRGCRRVVFGGGGGGAWSRCS